MENVVIKSEVTPDAVTQKGKRYNVIDGIRGIALISMIAYHAAWDLVYIFGVKWKWYYSSYADLWQQSICWTFIILSGFSYSLGRQHFRRGLTVFLGGAIVSAATLIAMPSAKILFGILTCIGSCMLLMIPTERILTKCNIYLGLSCSFLIFAFTYGVSRGYLGLFKLKLITLPEALYRNYITAFLGFPHGGFSSTDYFPILPWFFLFVFGYFIFRLMKERGLLRLLISKRIPPLEWIGKHTLPIYMAHQPIIYLICILIFR